MQRQEIITENDKDFLVVALPCLPEYFDGGRVSRSGKSFSFREWNFERTDLSGYKHFKLNPALLSGRIINSHGNFHKKEVVNYEFKSLSNVIMPTIKIWISKKLDK